VSNSGIPIIVLIIFYLFISCGPKPEMGVLPAKGSPEAVLSELTWKESLIHSVAQSMDIIISTPETGRRSLKGTLFNKGKSYYFKIEGTLGKDVATILIHDDTTLAYSPIQKSYYRVRSNTQIPDWGISIKDILRIVIGRYGFISEVPEYVGAVEGFYFYQINGDRYKSKLTVRPEIKNITGIRFEPVSTRSKEDFIDIRFAAFRNDSVSYRPMKITIICRNRGVEMDIRIKSEKRNPQLPDELFDLKIPSEAKEVSPHWFWSES